jgi:uncharacterized damage-inducible protein DinB
VPADLLKKQYALLQGSRQALFAYCETFTPEHFLRGIDSFGHGSIRNTLVHVANSYIHWLPNFGQGRLVSCADEIAVTQMRDVYTIYKQTDGFVETFLDQFANKLYTELNHKLPIRDSNLTTTPFNLFSHVLTHEYHHKGQILSMSRHLGYTPVDTDVIRF